MKTKWYLNDAVMNDYVVNMRISNFLEAEEEKLFETYKEDILREELKRQGQRQRYYDNNGRNYDNSNEETSLLFEPFADAQGPGRI